MESLQVYFLILCLLIIGLAFYFTSKRYRLDLAIAFSVALYILPLSHTWQLIWGKNLVFELCNADDSQIFAWTKCIGKDFSKVFLDSYEITIFLMVSLLRGYAIYLSVQRRQATMNFRLRRAWLYLIVLNTICICLGVLLFILPGAVLKSYVMPYNVIALMLSLLIVYLFFMLPNRVRKKEEEEEVPLNEFSIDSLSDSEI